MAKKPALCGKYFSFLLKAIVLVAFISIFLNLGSRQAIAAINQQINYQGKLTDSSNVAVADGNYNIVFKLYTASSGGSPIWTESWAGGGNKVSVESGLFSVMLGSKTSLSGIDFNQTLYLGVTVESDSEMTPRKILGSVPAAIEAFNLGGASSTQYLRSDQADTLSVNSSQTALAITQSGSGNVFTAGTSTATFLTLANNGNVGVGTTTPNFLLSVAGASNFTNALNFNGDAGTSGYILQSTGSGSAPQWVATSTLGISGGSLSGGTNGFLARWTSASTLSTGLLLDNGTVAGVNATSSSYTFNVQGNSGTNPFNVASSTGTSLFSILQNGNVGIGTTTPGALLAIAGQSGSTGQLFDVASSTGSSYLHVTSSGNVGVGTSTPSVNLLVQGSAGTNDAFRVASSSGSTVLAVASNGTLVLGNLSADPTTASNGATYYNTASNSFRCYVNGSWQSCDTTGSKFIQKTVDQNATSSNTTLGNDSQLGFTMAINSTYYIEGSIDYDMSNTAAGGKYSYTVPTGATINLETTGGRGDANLANCEVITSGSTCTITTPASPYRLRLLVHGIVTTGATPGDFRFQFAQAASTAAASPTVHAGSWFVITNSTNGGGADLAEIYYSKDSTVQAGDIVSLDPSIDAGVAKSTSAYDSDILGVISTDPGVVLGLSEVADHAGYTPVTLALSGRVPVKVSTENGPIAAGDYLTSSDVPGVAMKATKPGFVVGQAMTSYDGSDSTDANGIGTVTAFLKQTFYEATDPTSPSLQILKSASDPNAVVSDYTSFNNALNLINNTNLYSYTLKDEQVSSSSPSKLHVGFAADEASTTLLSDQSSINGVIFASIKALDLKLNNVSASTSPLSFSGSASLTALSDLKDFTNLSINNLDNAIASSSAATSVLSDGLNILTNQLASTTVLVSDLQSRDASTTAALAALDTRVASIESLRNLNSGFSLSDDLINTLQSFGSEIVDGISYLKNIFVQHFTAQNLTIKGKDITKTGFTIYDRSTGLPICVYFENGVQKTEAGECPDSTATSTPDIVPVPPSPQPDPISVPPVNNDDASSTPPTPEATSTPPITPPTSPPTEESSSTISTPPASSTDDNVSPPAPVEPPVTQTVDNTPPIPELPPVSSDSVAPST